MNASPERISSDVLQVFESVNDEVLSNRNWWNGCGISSGRDERVAKLCEFLGIKIVQTYEEPPCYDRFEDVIYLPPLYSFDSPAAYHMVLFHEIIHWTGHQKRLARTSLDAFDDGEGGYYLMQMEEYIADFGGLMLLEYFGLASSEIRRIVIQQLAARLKRLINPLFFGISNDAAVRSFTSVISNFPMEEQCEAS